MKAGRAAFPFQEVNWLTLDVDQEYVTITYSNGAQTSLLLGSIDLDGGNIAEEYVKRNGIIYPIDQWGNALLDANNTPNLVAIRNWYLTEARRENDERLEIAEIVHAFAENIASFGSHLENMRSE